MKKMYCIRKYVAAEDLLEAMQKDRKTPIHDCFIDDGWMRNHVPNMNRALGLPVQIEEDEKPLFG